ncbi:hypothetical protein H072_7880 [Dactylellina haptotyla CBS 200.50]|uniref:Uncharacterized protein n=1 Tax=Dactylellina haptotyla (strain CBS 200.50) TaxID=1284197 RepID=S8BGJ5_DACHA|nr:hypothetical protein H072_7880 [Dactylellina haptotyla CBS 200.50]
MSEENRRFLGSIFEKDRRLDIIELLKYPPSVTELLISTDTFTFDAITPQFPAFPNRPPTFLELFLIGSAVRPDVPMQLTKLEIRASSVIFECDPFGYGNSILESRGWKLQNYPTVKQLLIKTGLFTHNDARDLIKLFPNIETFDLDLLPLICSPDYAPEIAAYEDLIKLKKLWVAHLPWPDDNNADIPGQAGIIDLKSLMQVWTAVGSGTLELIDFASGPRPWHTKYICFKVRRLRTETGLSIRVLKESSIIFLHVLLAYDCFVYRFHSE